MMPELQALLFDVDGTLADTERQGHRVAFNAAFADAGLDWQWDESLYGELLAVAGGKERIAYYLQHFQHEFDRPADMDSFIADLHRRKTSHYQSLLAQGAIPLRPGVRRLLKEARSEGMRLAIATTTTLDSVTSLLDNGLVQGGASWFEVIAAGDVVPAKKPAPDIYLWAMRRMGLEPRCCLALEDSRNGLRAALDAGVGSLVITLNEYTRGQDFSGADLVLDHLGEPQLPCRAVAGDLQGRTWVDLALLRYVHGQSMAGSGSAAASVR